MGKAVKGTVPTVNDHELYVILKNNLIDIENFIKEIKAFIQEYKKDNPSQ